MTNPASDTAPAQHVEHHSALVSAMLHLLAAVAVPVFLGEADVVPSDRLAVFAGLEVALALISLAGYGAARRGHGATFGRLTTVETFGSAVSFGALAWYGSEVVSSTPSKHLLMITMLAVTSVTGLKSSMLEQRRSSSLWGVALLGASHFAAYAVRGELLFAAFTVLWCLTIAHFVRRTHAAFRELTELRLASEQTGRHDDLTQLLNRTAFMEKLRVAAGAGEPSALVLLDLDGFQAINDGFGHATGDAVLQTVAHRLSDTLPDGTSLSRLGGDEFAALVSMPDMHLARTVDLLIERVGEPIAIDGRDLYVAGSVGWAEVDGNRDATAILAEADAALYRSKTSATRSSTGFDPALRSELERSLERRQRFRDAVRQGRIEFRAQPIVDTADRRPVAVELLARWPAEDDVEIGADEFNRLADQTGLAVEFDRLALETAATLLSSWRSDPVLRAIVVKANISPIHLHNLVLARTIRDLVPDEDRRRLGLEFVEARMMDADHRHQALLRELQRAGVTLSIDDFGTGYSSLSYLRSLPVAEIKLDRSFVAGIDDDPVNQGLVRAIVDLAATLGLSTVAEGVERESELVMIADLGVGAAQGYAIARPLGLDDVGRFLRDRWAEPSSGASGKPG